MARRTKAQYNWDKLEFDETLLTKHFTEGRGGKIQFVVIHHMTIVGDGKGKALDACWNVWQTRQASAHYGVDGENVRQYVWDKDYAWATGNTNGNKHGLSIEHANSSTNGWTVSETTWKTGAKLAAYMHKRYGLGRPTSKFGGRLGTIRKHSSFKATACPGSFMDKIWPEYVKECQRVYDEITKPNPSPGPTPSKPELKKPAKQKAGWGSFVHLKSTGFMDYRAGIKKASKRTKGKAIDIDARVDKSNTLWALHWDTISKNGLHDPAGKIQPSAKISGLTTEQVRSLRGPNGQKVERAVVLMEYAAKLGVRVELELKCLVSKDKLARILKREVIAKMHKDGLLQFKVLASQPGALKRLRAAHEAGGTTLISWTGYKANGLSKETGWPVTDYERGTSKWV